MPHVHWHHQPARLAPHHPRPLALSTATACRLAVPGIRQAPASLYAGSSCLASPPANPLEDAAALPTAWEDEVEPALVQASATPTLCADRFDTRELVPACWEEEREDKAVEDEAWFDASDDSGTLASEVALAPLHNPKRSSPTLVASPDVTLLLHGEGSASGLGLDSVGFLFDRPPARAAAPQPALA